MSLTKVLSGDSCSSRSASSMVLEVSSRRAELGEVMSSSFRNSA
jgi:hypothetical protein